MNHPYYLNRKTILQHLMLHGATGSGKTAIVLMPLMEQLINLSARDSDSSIVIVDLKGDPAFFNSMKLACKKLDFPFRWFTTKLFYSSYGFNPFRQNHFRNEMTRNQAAEMFAKSFGLDFGQIYGGSYFRDMAVLVLRALLELPEIDSFAKLSQHAKSNPDFFQLPKKTAEQTTHLRAALDALATIEPLNVTPESSPADVVEQSIDIGSLHDTPQVVYFYLPSSLEDLICFTISKLVGYLLLTSASSRPVNKRNKIFFCIDEFQRIVSQDFALFVQQARGFDIGCILSSQTTSDLYSAGTDFADVLEENTATKIDLTGMGRRQAERLIEQSPEGIRVLESRDAAGKINYREEVVKTLSYDDLTKITATTGEGLIRTAMPYGLTQCGGRQVRFRASFHISADEYLKRSNTPWPNAEMNSGTLAITAGLPKTRKPQNASSQTEKEKSDKTDSVQKVNSTDSTKSRIEPVPNQPSIFQRLAKKILRSHSFQNEKEN